MGWVCVSPFSPVSYCHASARLRDVAAIDLRERGVPRLGVVTAIARPVGIGGVAHDLHMQVWPSSRRYALHPAPFL